jgi:hypothetical protein
LPRRQRVGIEDHVRKANKQELGAMMGRLAWVVLVSVGLLTVTGQVVAVRTGSGVDPFLIAGLSFPIVGALIASRQPRNAIGWVLLGLGAAMGLSAALGIYAYYALTARPGSLPGPGFALALDAPMWVPVIGLSGTFLILLFPDGRLPSARWKPWAYFCALALILCYSLLLILPADFAEAGYPDIRNPLGIDALEPFVGAVVSILALIPIAIVGCAVGLIRRFRRSRGRARVQLKWLAAAAGVVAITYLTLMALSLPSAITGNEAPGWVEALSQIGIFAFMLIPVAVGVAILRHRLYDIDIIINRTLVYGVLTAILSAAYFVVVTTLQGLLRPLAGQSEFAVAGSTLVVAAIFGPARGRIQAFVDRRFYRSKFDAEAILENFSARLRQEVDLETLTADLLAVLEQTMRPATSSLWLRPPAAAKAGTEAAVRQRDRAATLP